MMPEGAPMSFTVYARMCVCVCEAKSGRSTAAVSAAGMTVGGPCPGSGPSLIRSTSFITHSHLLAKKNSAICPGEASACFTYLLKEGGGKIRDQPINKTKFGQLIIRKIINTSALIICI